MPLLEVLRQTTPHTRRIASTVEKPRGITGETTEIVVLYPDVRSFSSWALDNPIHVAEVIELIYARVIQLVIDYHHSFHMLLGDGFLLLWEIEDFSEYDASKCLPAAGALSEALGAAFEIHKKYFYARKKLKFSSPLGFGIGIAMGTAYRVEPRVWMKELNEEDYVGYPMNAGARLQKLCNPYGVSIDRAGAAICRKCQR